MGRWLSTMRGLAVAVVAVGAGSGVHWLVAPALAALHPQRAGSAPFADLVVALAGLALLVVAGWLTLGVLTVVAGSLLRRGTTAPGSPSRRTAGGRVQPRPRWLPRRLHRAVLLGCGVAVTTAALSPAAAAPSSPAASHTGGAADCPTATVPGPAGLLGGLPLPDRVAGPPAQIQPAPIQPAPIRPARVRLVRVHPGDSLWSVTRRLLPEGAGDRAVAHGWPLLYRANRDRLGPDPDLVPADLVLRIPARLGDHRATTDPLRKDLP